MVRLQVMSTKYEIELFDNKSNFTLQQGKIVDIRIAQGLDVALEKGKFIKIKVVKQKSMKKIMASQIHLVLAPEEKYNVLSETTPSSM